MIHYIDARRPEGSAITKRGRIRQVPIICPVDLLTVIEDEGDADYVTGDGAADAVDLVDCPGCLAIIDRESDVEIERIIGVVTDHLRERPRLLAGTPHVCQLYRNARGELVDPATQGGIGCPVCCPPGGRVEASI